MLIKWNDSFIVGIDLIDNDHKKIVDCINVLDEAKKLGRQEEALAQIVHELIEYTRTHLEHEEALMQKAGYPGYDDHLGIHFFFRQSIARFEEALKQEKKPVGEIIKISILLQRWLIDHIQEVDRKMAKFVLSRIPDVNRGKAL